MNRALHLLIAWAALCLASAGKATQAAEPNGAFSFSLPAPANTSAGVFKADGTLVRTLWSTVRYAAGAHTEFWDGSDD